MLVPAQFTNLLKIKINTPIIRVESAISSMSGKPLVYARVYNNPFESVMEITLQYDETHPVAQPGVSTYGFVYGTYDGSMPQYL